MTRHSLIALALWLIVVPGQARAAEQETENGPQAAVRLGDGSASGSAGRDAPSAVETTDPRLPPPRNPRVLFIVDKNCDRCEKELARLRKPGGDFEAMQARGWKIGASPDKHVQIVDREAIPELISELNVREFPTVACVNDGEIVRSFKEGCTTPLDAWTFGFLLKGENERPRGAILETARVKWTGSYPLRGNHWSIDGDWSPTQEKVVNHLRGPNHGHQIAASWSIEAWSYEELRSLHDDLHERELASGATASSGTSMPAYGGSAAYSSGASTTSSGSGQFSATRKMLGR
jgi:hypothetical protein